MDIYSLGIMLYKLLNHGRFPFYAGGPASKTRGCAGGYGETLVWKCRNVPARADLELWQILHRTRLPDEKRCQVLRRSCGEELTVYLNRMGSNSKPKRKKKQLITNTDFPEQESTWEETSKTLSMWGNGGTAVDR